MNSYASIFVGDFNAHNRSWWNGDRTDSIGSKLEKIFLDNSLNQLVREPMHLSDKFSSCIELTVTRHPNIFAKCYILPSIYENCHHQINQCKFPIEITPPDPYTRRV